MPTYDNDDELFSSNSQFLSPSSSSPHRPASRQNIKKRSTSSLRASSKVVGQDDSPNGRFSLAHELAAALMPEPSTGSKLLAEEFGIEYDEGAEGIDEPRHLHDGSPHIVLDGRQSFADEVTHGAVDDSFHDTPYNATDAPSDFDPVFGSPLAQKTKSKRRQQDAMEILSQDLESTDKFLSHLRRIDAEGSSAPPQPTLERMASDVIRHIDESTRDREGQVRELLEYEREFRKIAGEVGGDDVLGQLDELVRMEGLIEKKEVVTVSRQDSQKLHVLEEEPSHFSQSHEWEVDPDQQDRLLEDDDLSVSEASPVKDSFPPPPVVGPPTPATTIPQLADLRSFTASLVSSLTTISEQAQVNGAATTEAGRKIRALKNKMGGMRTDWDSAERSMAKIERWEAGMVGGTEDNAAALSSSARKRIDGRQIVKEHLDAFQRALADAAVKTQAIMATS